MVRDKLNTQAMGLDIGLAFVKWLTGAENLHYGYWAGLDVTAANLLAAQEAFATRLFGLIDDRPLRILDIGGGAGEIARKLLALGHRVDIVVPSPYLVQRCRINAPGATVHQCRFEDFTGTGPFDLCLFSESFQYIPLDQGLARCLTLLDDGGKIVLADCFRREGFTIEGHKAVVGGGHAISAFRATLAALPLEVVSEEDITHHVAPSVEIEQGLFNVLGCGISRVDQELAAKRPALRWGLSRAVSLFLDARKRARLNQRLNEQTRSTQVFAENNIYLMMRLRRTG